MPGLVEFFSLVFVDPPLPSAGVGESFSLGFDCFGGLRFDSCWEDLGSNATAGEYSA